MEIHLFSKTFLYICLGNVVWEDEAAVTKVMESMSKSYVVLKEIQRKGKIAFFLLL